MIAAISGATGLTGSYLIRELVRDSQITKVISVGRKSTGINDAKLVEVLLPDLADLKSKTTNLKADIYFCCLGTTIKLAGSQEKFRAIDHDAILAFAQIAKSNDAKSFTLVSAMGANASSFVFYNKVKGQTEDDVTALNLTSLTIFRPALLTGPRQGHRAAEQFATRAIVPIANLLPQRAKKSLVTEAETLAKRMLNEGKRTVKGTQTINAAQI